MNDIELQVVEGTAFMAFGELGYAQHNKKMFLAARSNPDMLPDLIQVWLDEWVRMADEMIEQCAAMYVLGSCGKAIFENEDDLARKKSEFKTRMQKMREDAINDAANDLKRGVLGQ
jgi:hypothetical protein